MILKQDAILERIRDKEKQLINPLFIVPSPFTADELSGKTSVSGAASVDLRLGTWFLVAHRTKVPFLEISKPSRMQLILEELQEKHIISAEIKRLIQPRIDQRVSASASARMHHVRFGDDFVLHPRSFALACTIEWLRIPTDLAGYVTGRSSLGRRGLIIARAGGVPAGFTGCLTVAFFSLGDMP